MMEQNWHRALRRFLIAISCGNLIWEIAQMPLYTLWLTGTPAEISFAILHCTLGDILIALSSLTTALLLVGTADWPRIGFRLVAVTMMAMALSYTVFSEWLNIELRQSWAYRDIMPTLPPLNTGLSPMLQWIVVPWLAFRWAGRAQQRPAPLNGL